MKKIKSINLETDNLNHHVFMVFSTFIPVLFDIYTETLIKINIKVNKPINAEEKI